MSINCLTRHKRYSGHRKDREDGDQRLNSPGKRPRERNMDSRI